MTTAIAFDPGYGGTKVYGPQGGLNIPSAVSVGDGKTIRRMVGLRSARPPLRIETSAGALNEDLLAAMQPDLAVISVGADNRFGHPAASTLALLSQKGVQTLRTDQAGDIEVIVGAQAWKVNAKNR